MPLLQIPALPSMARVAQEGVRVRPSAAGRPLRVGLLNMMPDRALEATERQFLRLLDAHDDRCCAVRLFSIRGVPRGDDGAAHLARHYRDCAEIGAGGLDALVITGANVTRPDLSQEPFWEELAGLLERADRARLPTVCSCLAAHAAARLFHGIERRHLARKRWGVFAHEVLAPEHPLLADVPARFDMPHSRFNDIAADELAARGVQVLAAGPEAGVQLAVEPDGRRLYFQGHPEYEAISLVKEYKREALRFLAGERRDYPPLPDRTLDAGATRAAEDFQRRAEAAPQSVRAEDFPEARLARGCGEPWREVARTLYRNWLDGLPA